MEMTKLSCEKFLAELASKAPTPGGGGTAAAYIANLDVNTIDVGVPVLSMHAPFEITAKTDIWAAYRAFEAFVNN